MNVTSNKSQNNDQISIKNKLFHTKKVNVI